MVLVGEPAMVEAVRTTASTFGIWAIIAVAMICLAAWLISIYVADSQQTRMSRMRRRMDAPGPVLSGAEESAAASIPGQRRDVGQPEPEPASETVAARGRHARPAEYYAAADFYAVADYKAAEKPPAGNAATSARAAGRAEASGAEASGAEADRAEASGAEASGAEADRAEGDRAEGSSQADAPTRPDLPAQAAPTGRHAMPSQRSGDSDRAERAHTGTDADGQDDQDQR
jgi:hypothetical protein